MLKFGINLNDQEINKELARVGSVSNQLATVDMSMASDTMALELIPFLFPKNWCDILLLLRSERYEGELEGKYHKFSSMGNGMTFVLESIVFAAAAHAVGSKTVSVFGDDIIIDSDKFQDLCNLLSFLGFTTNEEKSYHTGPFRESCGGDYWAGVDIRPFTVKEDGQMPKAQLCHYVNGLASIAGENLAILLRSLVRKYRLPLVPYNENTRSGIFVDASTAWNKHLLRPYLRKRGDGICSYRSYVETPRTRTVRDVRTLVLWHIAKATNPDSDHIATQVALGASTSWKRRSWWIPRSTPCHLFWWSDVLTG
jgi:hypothetical protein